VRNKKVFEEIFLHIPKSKMYKNYGRERLDFTERLRTVIAAKRQP